MSPIVFGSGFDDRGDQTVMYRLVIAGLCSGLLIVNVRACACHQNFSF